MTNPFELIESRLSNIESLLIDLKNPSNPPPAPDPDRWFSLPELIEYLPEKPKVQTVYSWVSNALIPVNKKGKRLYFLKSEIDLWLKSGRRKTFAELQQEAGRAKR
jgi:hypothetical protein